MTLDSSRPGTRDLAIAVAAIAFAFGLALVMMGLSAMFSDPMHTGAWATAKRYGPGRTVQQFDASTTRAAKRMTDRLRPTRSDRMAWSHLAANARVHQRYRGAIDTDRDHRNFFLNVARQLFAPVTAGARGAEVGQTYCCAR